MKPIPVSEQEKNAFRHSIEPFNKHWPTLRATLDKAFYTRLELPDKHGIPISGLGKQCAETSEEIWFVCTNGYGIAGTKLLRGLFERAVAAAYFAKNPEAVRKFLDSFDVDFGRLLHRYEEFLQASGADPSKILPAELLRSVEEDYKLAKEKEERCEKCGSPKARMDVLSMAQNASPRLVPYYGPCFLEPTLHVHCTWYSVLEGVNVGAGQHHVDFNPQFEGKRALRTLQLAHFVILDALETQSGYFRLALEDEITQQREDYTKLWDRVAL